MEKLSELLNAIKLIRQSDCGAWLKECSGYFTCAAGTEKRQELAKLLDNLYKIAKRK